MARREERQPEPHEPRSFAQLGWAARATNASPHIMATATRRPPSPGGSDGTELACDTATAHAGVHRGAIANLNDSRSTHDATDLHNSRMLPSSASGAISDDISSVDSASFSGSPAACLSPGGGTLRVRVQFRDAYQNDWGPFEVVVCGLANTKLSQVFELARIKGMRAPDGPLLSPSPGFERTDGNGVNGANLSSWKLVRIVSAGRVFEAEKELQTQLAQLPGVRCWTADASDASAASTSVETDGGQSPQARDGSGHGLPSMIFCTAFLARRAFVEQKFLAHPSSCSTDGGVKVTVAGECFPSRAGGIWFRFGRDEVSAIQDEEDSNLLWARAPPHEAGVVTLSISFDSARTWLPGPVFTYYDGRCPAGQAIAVPVTCASGSRVGVGRILSDTLAWEARWSDPRDGGGGAGAT